MAETTLDDVTEAMKDVIDPELGINVIDLGLVYDMTRRWHRDARHDPDLSGLSIAGCD